MLTKYRSYTQYQRTLVDWIYRTTSTYAPHDLTAVSRAGLSGGGSVRSLVLTDLKAMTAAARRAGAPIAAESAYRSYRTQVVMFSSWVRRLGYRPRSRARPERAIRSTSSARPSTSRATAGRAVGDQRLRLGAVEGGGLDEGHAWRYGFVMSYPSGRKSQVCYGYEPWHYRYYGRAIAAAMHASSLTPRYWLWRHGSNQ